MERYSLIEDKNPREIVLLRGRGCVWKKCTFCDYHLDCSNDEAANLALNRSVLAQVTGRFGRLEAINSGSLPELGEDSLQLLEDTCAARGIRDLHIECHWLFRGQTAALRERFAKRGVRLHVKLGVETFDAAFRENVLQKGIDETDPAVIAQAFDDCCLLFGLTGQTAQSMAQDVALGLQHFDRVCINLMCENSTDIHPDAAVLQTFLDTLYPSVKDDPRVDILLENTDFGVGGQS